MLAWNGLRPLHVWLVEINDSLPGIDGGQRPYRAGMLAEALLAHGHEVLWWSSTFNHQQKRQRSDKSVTVSPCDRLTIRMIYGPGYSRNRSVARLLHNRAVALAFSAEAHAAMRARRPDVIVAHFPSLEVTHAAVEFGRVHNVPVLVDIRDQYPDAILSTSPRWLRPFLRLACALIARKVGRVFAVAAGITAVSHANLAWALAKAGRRATWTDQWFPLGFPGKHMADTCKGQVGNFHFRRREFTIVFVGSFVRAYDFDTVLAAAEFLVPERCRDIRFVLVGDGDRMERIRKRVQALPNVVLPGWCDRRMVGRILARADVGLAPYSRGALITLPNKPFEYMAAGVPVLHSLEGELAELVATEQIGLQYRAGDPLHLAAQIQWLKDHPDVLKEMGQRARRLFEARFTAEGIYQGFCRHLEKVASEKGCFQRHQAPDGERRSVDCLAELGN